MRKFIACFVLIFISLTLFLKPVQGQREVPRRYEALTKFPVLTVNHRNYSTAEALFDDQLGNVHVYEFNTALQLAFPIKKEKLYFMNNFVYNYSNIATTGFDIAGSGKDFHTINCNIGLIALLPKGWNLALNTIPILSSDLGTSLHSDDLRFNTAVFARKRVNADKEYGFGLAYTSYVPMLEKSLIVPLYSLVRRRNRHTTNLLIPSHIQHTYKMNEKSDVGVRLAINANMYNMEYDNKFSVYDLNGISMMKLTLGPEYRRRLFRDFHLDFSAGYTVASNWYLLDNELRQEVKLPAKDKFFMHMGLVVLK